MSPRVIHILLSGNLRRVEQLQQELVKIVARTASKFDGAPSVIDA